MGKRSFIDILRDHRSLQSVFAGYEQGFNERADAVVQAADGTDLNEFFSEIQATLALRNAQRNRLIDAVTFRVTTPIDMVGVPATGAFEAASEYGQPVGIRGGKRFNRGYTFDFYDLAARYTWMFLAEADRRQLENINNMALEADNNLLFNAVFKTLFNPVNLVGVADSNIPVNVYKFYNGDGEVPPPWKNNTFLSTHTHYIGSNNATLVPATLTLFEDDMISHGYGAQTGTQLVLWVNRAQGKVIRGFRVAGSAVYDFIPSEAVGGGTFLPASMGIVGKPGGQVPGEIGTYGPFHIVEEEYIPPGYMVCLAAGGPDNLVNPIGIREHSNPSYQGLKIIPGARSEYPLIDSFYRRGFGTGVRQRGGGMVIQVVASTTYTTPTLYV